MKAGRLNLPFLLFVLGLMACTPEGPNATFIVGVSQVGNEEWFQKMDAEMQQEALFHPEMQLRFRNAHYDIDLQCNQIDSFIAEQVDLLIVGPSDVSKVCEAAGRAFDKGIPVLMTSHYGIGEKYTAFVCMSNYAIGQEMARFLIDLATQSHSDAKNPLQAIEILGPLNISPTELRHGGLTDKLTEHPEVQIVASVAAYWHRVEAQYIVDSLLGVYPDVTAIVAQGDEMAIGAARASQSLQRSVHIMGVDAMAGKDAGIEAILKGDIEASVMNTSRGDLVIRTAADILNQRPYEKEQFLPVVRVNAESPQLMLRMSEEMNQSHEAIETLQSRVNYLWGVSGSQRWVIIMLIVLVVLIIVVALIVRNVQRSRQHIHEQLAQQTQLVNQQQQQLDALTARLAEVAVPSSLDEQFVQRLQDYVEAHLTDSSLSIETIQKYMGVSRTQLFRKTREKLGVSPIDLIRHIRLHRAEQMLKTTKLTVQEIAYAVGFSSPSYFTKCYRQEFGTAPTKKNIKNTSAEL